MRKTTLSLVIALTLGSFTSSLATNARAQAPSQPGSGYGPGGYVPGQAWRYYPPGSIWEGYSPGTAWRGYSPPVVADTPAPTPAPPAGTVYISPTQPVQRYIYPQVTYQPQRQVVTRSGPYGGRAVTPAFYREFGTGRNVFLHKPWLPNQ